VNLVSRCVTLPLDVLRFALLLTAIFVFLLVTSERAYEFCYVKLTAACRACALCDTQSNVLCSVFL